MRRLLLTVTVVAVVTVGTVRPAAASTWSVHLWLGELQVGDHYVATFRPVDLSWVDEPNTGPPTSIEFESGYTVVRSAADGTSVYFFVSASIDGRVPWSAPSGSSTTPVKVRIVATAYSVVGPQPDYGTDPVLSRDGCEVEGPARASLKRWVREGRATVDVDFEAMPAFPEACGAAAPVATELMSGQPGQLWADGVFGTPEPDVPMADGRVAGPLVVVGALVGWRYIRRSRRDETPVAGAPPA